MFDINLINQPGIQKNGDNNDVNTNSSSKNKDNNTVVDDTSPDAPIIIQKDKKYFSFFIFLIVLISLIIYVYSYNKFINSNIEEYQLFYLEDVVDILEDNQLEMNADFISFNQNELLINLNCRNEKSFYRIFDSFSNIIMYNVKGYHIKDTYVLSIKLPWKIKSNKNFTIDSLNKETMDFDLGLRQELYQNKLIIVSDFDKIIKFINLLIGMDLIDNFFIDIRQIESLPDGMDLYQVIVE
tara:strand:+ start:488 stop:1207 length:720 start_codon:yes stop_codon:yes gene_type:complete